MNHLDSTRNSTSSSSLGGGMAARSSLEEYNPLDDPNAIFTDRATVGLLASLNVGGGSINEGEGEGEGGYGGEGRGGPACSPRYAALVFALVFVAVLERLVLKRASDQLGSGVVLNQLVLFVYILFFIVVVAYKVRRGRERGVGASVHPASCHSPSCHSPSCTKILSWSRDTNQTPKLAMDSAPFQGKGLVA